MPNLIGGIVLGYIWQLHLQRHPAATAPHRARYATYGFWGLIVLMCWQQVGYMMIIYIAGLQSVSDGYAGGRAYRRRKRAGRSCGTSPFPS